MSGADHMELRLAAAGPSQKAVITRANLVALLEAFDALLVAGQSKRKAAAKKAASAAPALPAWLPLEQWEAFLAMRVTIKKPATAKAQDLLIKKLAKFMAQGQMPAAILEQSIIGCWQDLYALKDTGRGFGYDPAPARPARLTRDQQQALANDEALRRLDGIPAFDPNTIDMEAGNGSR